jgi:hypothetical protein
LINGIFAGKTGRREEKVACGANRHGGHVPYNLKPGNEELYADAREFLFNTKPIERDPTEEELDPCYGNDAGSGAGAVSACQ